MPVDHENTTDEQLYVEAALPLPIRRTFTYRVPNRYGDEIWLGSRLLVPFGKRTLTGYAVAIHRGLDHDAGVAADSVKDIIEVIDNDPLINAEILDLTLWTADYYAASWGEVLKASLPAGINATVERVYRITASGRERLEEERDSTRLSQRLLQYLSENPETTIRRLAREFTERSLKGAVRELERDGLINAADQAVATKVKPKLRKAVRLLDGGSPADTKPLSEMQQKVVDTLKVAGGEMLFTDLLEKADIGASPISTLARRGLLEISVQEVRRDPLEPPELLADPPLSLNPGQSFVFNRIEKSLNSGEYRGFLLHGVTGSGKTEVYIRAMRSALNDGRSSLMLVPEIALTPVFSRRLQAVFGSDVAILHSNLSPGERFDEWRRIRSGDARIVIGTRSAVFAPLADIGLVIVDEEHDSSYRQNEAPFYNARDVAVVRANKAGAVIVLGSATPALETFHNAKRGKYEYLQLQNRIGDRPLAAAELIDMRAVFRKAGKDVVFSPQLLDAIRDTYRKGEQSIVLLNRRGFSSFVLCRSCGESLRCKNCDITMTYHKIDRRLVCHYCNHTVATPTECPFCQSEYLYFIGQGTEKLEELLNRIFPEMRIARVDRDTMQRKGEISKTLFAFDRGEIDMLVGTQMLAKGHDFHNVTLVGVVSVDTGLGLPDFRSAERTFQLITQVAGRAGRGQLRGTVLIQTYYPEHYALRFAAAQDYEGFYNEEIKFRERLSYPPFVAIASIMIKHKDREYAMKSASILRSALDDANPDRQIRILGPAQASIGKIKNEYRIQLILKSANRRSLRDTLDAAVARAETSGCDRRIVQIEIDPVDLM